MKKLTSLVLVLSMLLSLLAVPMGATAQELDNNFSISQLLEASSGDESTDTPADGEGAIYSEGKVWFDLNGNARLFMDSTTADYTNRKTITNYVPGVDYTSLVTKPTGTFAADKAAIYTGGERFGCFPYTIDLKTVAKYSTTQITDFSTKNGNIYWTINDTDYLIKPDKNVIKVTVGGSTTTSIDSNATLTDAKKAELKAKFASLAEMTIDVPDKKYESIGVLAGIFNKWNRYVKFTMNYSTGESVTHRINVAGVANGSTYNFSTGSLFFQRMDDFNAGIGANDWHTFKPYDLTTDSSRVLTSITITPTNELISSGADTTSPSIYPVYVLSAWGVQAKEVSLLDSLVEELAALNTAGIANEAQLSAVESKIAEIDAYILENSAELTTQQKEVCEEAKAFIKAYKDLKEQESQITSLTQKLYLCVDIEDLSDVDLFAPYADIANFARFNKSVSGATSGYFNKTTIKYTPEGETETDLEIFDWLPPETYEQIKIYGTEDYYKKGVGINPSKFATAISTFMYVADPLMSDVDQATGYRYSADDSSTAAMVYAGTLIREPKNMAFSTDHIKERITEGGKKYAVIENYGVRHKIGPFASEFSPNAVYASTSTAKLIPVDAEGTSIEVLMGTSIINATGSETSKLATGKIPEAAIQKFTVKYDDETEKVKYPIFLNTAKTGAATALERIIIYTEKKTDGTGWTTDDFYGDNKKEFEYLTAENQTEHYVDVANVRPSEVVKFENDQFIMQDTASVTTLVGNRQDTNKTSYNDRVSLVSIPLEKGKKVKSLESVRYYDYAESTMPESMIVAGGGTTNNPRVAVIPVTIEGANDAYDYFVYIGGGNDNAFIMGASVAGYSLKDKIEMLEERMVNVSSETESIAIDLEMADLIENTIVEKTDFNADILAAYEITKKEFAGQAAEEERLESLKNREYTYLDYEKDRDVFITYQDLVDYGRFNTAAVTGSSSARVNEKYTYAEGIELFRYLPHITSTGVEVTGQEDYYFKGFQNSANNNLPAAGERGYVSTSAYAYLSDSFFVADGTEVKGSKVSASASTTSKDYYEGKVQRSEGKRTINAPSIVKPIDEDGYVIVKNGDVLSKVGPVSQTEIKANAARFGNSKGTTISNVNTKGTSLDLLVTTTTVNTAGGYTTKKTATDPSKNYLATEAVPTAAIQEVVITYKDGTVENKKILLTNTAASSATDTAYRSIVFAPKYKDGEEIIYNEKSFYLDSEKFDFKAITKDNVTTIGVSSVKDINADTVKFANKNIHYSTVGHLATLVNNRQDTVNSNYGDYTNYVSIPLQNKEVESINFPYNINAALDEADAIEVANETTNTAEPSIALLPIEIEGASDDFVYFVYCGRVAQDGYLMGATIMDISAQEKIDNAEKAMSAITENSTLEEAKKAKELYEMACEEELIVAEKDFDAEIVSNFFITYEKVRENTDLYAEVDLKYYKGDAPKANVTIYNAAELADKPYTVIMAYYGEDGAMLDKDIISGVTTTEETVTLTFENAEFPAETKKVKVLVWKDFATLLPLGEVAVAEEIEKKIYMFVGDSITHSDEYRTHTEAFFMTRFPDKKAEFTNAGRSGGTAGTAHRRVEWDMKRNDATHAVIMFGMNDVGRANNYTPGANTTDEVKQKAIDTCLENIEILAGMLEEDGIDITLMTPSIYDEREYSAALENLVGVNGALTKVADGVKALAQAKKYSVIDTNTNMNEVNQKIWDTGNIEMNIRDRVHPSPAGTYVIAYNVIKGLFPNSEVVAEVTLNATAESSETTNATVEDVKFEDGKITYNYTAKALPWAATTNYTKADGRYVDLTDELNREIIKVSGLEEGTYKIAFDGVEIGSFTKDELEAGVNIAILEKNPGQVQSKEVYDILNQKHSIYQKLRSNAQAEDTLRARGIHEDPEKIAAYIADGEAAGNDMNIYKNYASEKSQEAERYAMMEDYTNQARAKAVPATHVVTISK